MGKLSVLRELYRFPKQTRMAPIALHPVHFFCEGCKHEVGFDPFPDEAADQIQPRTVVSANDNQHADCAWGFAAVCSGLGFLRFG